MNIDDLTLRQIKEIKAMAGFHNESDEKDILSDFVGRKVLIRDNKAGIFVTTLMKIKGSEWLGGESRKIYFWDKAGAVEGISMTGISDSGSRVTVKTPNSNGKDLVQLCPLSDEQFEELMGLSVWNPK